MIQYRCALVQVAIAFGTGEVQGEFVSEVQTMPAWTPTLPSPNVAGCLPQR